jgi:hypothetical protein
MIKQVDKFTSFANQLTHKYVKNLDALENNINVSLTELQNLKTNYELNSILQYYLYLGDQLLQTLKTIERTVSLALNDIVNLELISTSELLDMIEHLRLTHKPNELLKLDQIHPMKMLEFSIMKVVSIDKTIVCILHIPLVKPETYQYQQIIPIPNKFMQVLAPPAQFRLISATEELWTDEKCSRIESELLCAKKPRSDKCSLKQTEHCVFVNVKNNFNLAVRLSNNQILVTCSKSTQILEECENDAKLFTVHKNALLSSNCTIVFNQQSFENVNITYKIHLPEVNILDIKSNLEINFNIKHLEDVDQIIKDANELKSLELDPIVHVAHFSGTSIILLSLIAGTVYLAYKKIVSRGNKNCNDKPKGHSIEDVDVLS